MRWVRKSLTSDAVQSEISILKRFEVFIFQLELNGDIWSISHRIYSSSQAQGRIRVLELNFEVHDSEKRSISVCLMELIAYINERTKKISRTDFKIIAVPHDT